MVFVIDDVVFVEKNYVKKILFKNVARTNVVFFRCSQEATCKVSSKSGQ